jgi:hypothetical protein
VSATTTSRPAASSARRGRGWNRGLTLLVVLGLAVGGWMVLRDRMPQLALMERCTVTAGGGHTDLDPEQARYAAVISAVAVRRELPARAATIAIATAMQESKLRNLEYGDRDSVGLFQQRPSQGWGTRRQLLDPVYATNAFYDVLVKVEGYQSLPITSAAQRVQRSAYPSAYADHEPEARIAASALTGYSPAALTCTLRPAGSRSGQPGADGLTPAAHALAASARAEAGLSGQAVAGSGGTAVQFTPDGPEARRLGWSLAQWAVARAKGLDVISVSTDGRRWRRDAPKEGWATGGSTPAGTVVVRVAGGG